jgi:uncharacterized membrane protein
MYVLVAGLLIFLGIHSTRIFAEGWRNRTIERIGKNRWMRVYTLSSIAGFVLIVWGYGLARQMPVLLWDPPLWGRHLTVTLMAVSFFLVAQNGSPQGPLVARLGHPMMIAIGIWSAAHLMANGTLADLLMFGSFLIWSVLGYIAAVKRDRMAGTERQPAGWRADLGPGVAGLALWFVFVWKAHQWLFGVSPLG